MSATTRTSPTNTTSTSRSAFTVGTVTISGAAPAASLTGRTETACIRQSTHAPAARTVPLSSMSLRSVPTATDDGPRSCEGSRTSDGPRANEEVSGAAVWQDFVRMLIAREAAKAAHPSGRGLATA